MEIYSTHHEGKSFITKRFIKILKNKTCKRMTSVSKNIYTKKLDDIVNKYNNIYHGTIKMKPFDVKSNTYIDSSKKLTKIRNLKPVLQLEYQNIKIFLKVTLQIGLMKLLRLKKLKTLFCGHIY